MSKPSPCNGCTERFSACSVRCPKSASGEYGYPEWKADLDAEKQAARLRNSIDFVNAKPRGKWMQSW